jgi:hypothetical protein
MVLKRSKKKKSIKKKEKPAAAAFPSSTNVSLPFPISIVCWIDLLGYGAAMSAARFNPLHPSAKSAINRLRRFHRIVSEQSHRRFHTLVMNDGAAAYRDLDLRSNERTYDFLCRAWTLHSKIMAAETSNGDPGARMVIASGFRMRGRRAGLDERGRQVRDILERFDDGKITLAQAIAQGEHLSTTYDMVPQLQANFAFTKAYLAEQAGTKGGFAGAQCFVDTALFAGPAASLTLGAEFSWTHPKLAIGGSFAPMVAFTDSAGDNHDTPPNVRTGLAVGIHLTQDPELLSSLMRAQKS